MKAWLKKNAWKLVIGAVAILFAVFVWPTRYTHGTYKGTPMRTNRITGAVDLLYVGRIGGGWKRITTQPSH